MGVTGIVAQAMRGEVRSIGLWGGTPDGPAECSFDGYSRQPARDGTVSGDRISWPAVTFRVTNPTGVTPLGWALFDADGLMLHHEVAQMGVFMNHIDWHIAPTLKVERVK